MDQPRPSVVQLGPYPPPMGGVQTNLAAIHRLLRQRGHEAWVINLTRFRSGAAERVLYPDSALATLRLLLTLPASIVHLHVGGDLPLRLIALAGLCTLLPGRRSVFTFHSGGYPDSPAGRSAGWWTLRGFVLRRFDRLIAVNPQLADLFARFGVKPERIRVIPPYALPLERPAGALPEPLETFFATHDPVLVSMGWLEPEYDFALQIRALPRIRERWPNAGLAILGEGRLRPDLERERDAGGAAAHVLLAGDQPHEVALLAAARAGLCLRTTHFDGDAISVREALHLGTPVVATDNGMRPAGVTLFAARDAEGFIEAVDRALRAPRPQPGGPADALRHIEAVVGMYGELRSEQGRASGK